MTPSRECLEFINDIFCIPIIRDVIEHLVVCPDCHDSNDVNAIASKLANVHTLEVVYVLQHEHVEQKVFKISNILLSACVLGKLRNICFIFRGFEPSTLEGQLKDADEIQQLQHRILDLSPKSVTFDADAFGDRRETFLSKAEVTKNMLKESFPKLFGQEIAKIVVVQGEYKVIP